MGKRSDRYSIAVETNCGLNSVLLAKRSSTTPSWQLYICLGRVNLGFVITEGFLWELHCRGPGLVQYNWGRLDGCQWATDDRRKQLLPLITLQLLRQYLNLF